jgi:pimeloyl-ACP methyl ester carboxylesterase
VRIGTGRELEAAAGDGDTGDRTGRRSWSAAWSRSCFVAILLLVPACRLATPFIDRLELATDLATANGWATGYVTTDDFRLARFGRGLDQPGDTLVVYIEGDGLAWLSRHRQSSDPTPTNPMGLRLAVRDPAAKVAYLGRPCQFSDGAMDRNCGPAYWGSHRYAEPVIRAIDQAVGILKRQAGATRLRLVGYSGGGTVAVLVAARRTDVAQVVTVAANLDHARWTELHRVTPLAGSLNAADHAARLQGLPQLHLVGEDDEVVPPQVVEAYVARMRDTSRTAVVVVPDFGHTCCWAEAWPGLLARHGTVRAAADSGG